MSKQPLQALAELTKVDVAKAVTFMRHHPLWQEEIPINEELINLEEAFASARAASANIRDYPSMRTPIVREQRDILTHCVGLLARMTDRHNSKQLPRPYTQADILIALTKLTRLIITEAIRVGKQIDSEILKVLQPYLSVNQRMQLREWRNFNIMLELQIIRHKLFMLRQIQR